MKLVHQYILPQYYRHRDDVTMPSIKIPVSKEDKQLIKVYESYNVTVQACYYWSNFLAAIGLAGITGTTYELIDLVLLIAAQSPRWPRDPVLTYVNKLVIYEGRPINKLQDGIILLIFKI